ncbi:aromatic ring-hydroxylating dioxygenase subunit alpha [Paenarthrobacter sp. NPDC091669]|uniref:aromatic ring-hydroxylating oxygenase subunit alpha n=1 Tax=Paenarthrobacter sp. NPDC091669 TaxID=3364384 RepID=UPI00381D5E00
MSSVIERDTYFTSLPQNYYLSPDLYEVDLSKVWRNQWLLAGHVSQIPRKGSYFTFEMANESLIITRGANDSVNALHNTCRHRGFRICEAGSSGQTRRVVCPYHAWSFELDGQLMAAPSHSDGEGFDFRDFGLHRAQVEVWQGFIFVNFSEEPLSSLADELKNADDSFCTMKGDRMKIAATIEYPCAANWKLLMENILECYHCAPSHPELCQVLDLEEMHNHHQEWTAARPYDHSYMPLKKGLQSLTRDGSVVSKKLLGEYADGRPVPEGFATGFVFQPTGIFSEFYVDHGITTKVFPVSPTESKLIVDWYVNAEAEEGVDYQLEELTFLWDVTTQQDIALTEGQQLGVNSSKYTPGPNSSTREPGIRSSLELYLSMIGDPASVKEI